MIDKDVYFEMSREIIDFFCRFGKVNAMQLEAVQEDMKAAAEKLMSSVEHLSQTADSQKAKAEEDLVQTHLNPDMQVQSAMNANQAAVDALLDSLMGDEAAPESVAGPESLSREGGKFSKSVEAISGLASKMIEPLLNITGVLSIEDVVGQRLAHISSTTEALTEDLGFLLTDIERNLSAERIKAFVHQLLKVALSKYTIVNEKKLYKSRFPQDAEPYSINEGDPGLNSLLAFLADFNQLLAAQLEAVSGNISETISSAMASIMSIGNLTDEQRRHADTMLVKNNENEDDKFVAKSIKEHEESEDKGNNENFGGSREQFDSFENELNAEVLKMMAEMSIEDVVGQRIEHVVFSFSVLQELVQEVVAQWPISPRGIDTYNMTGVYLEKVFKSYTMESEKQIFFKIFPERKKEYAPQRKAG